MRKKHLPLPSRMEVKAYVKKHYAWKAMDDVFYRLCRLKSGKRFTLEDILRSSAQAIGLTYRAVIGRGWSLDPMGKAIVEWSKKRWGHWTQAELDQLPKAVIPSKEGLESAVRVHSEFCYWLRKDLGKHGYAPRSFVAKWLHFHARGVPIYDRNSCAAIEALDLRPVHLDCDPGNDPKYKNFCERFLAFSKHVGAMSVRELDVYLYLKGMKLTS